MMNIFKLILVFSFIFSGVVMGQDSLDDAFSTPNLSDQQTRDANEFIHQGQRDRVVQEGCKDINDCKIEEGFPLEMMIGKAYGLIGTFLGGGMTPTLNKKPNQAQIEAANKANKANNAAKKADPNAKEVKPEKDKMPDYCMYGVIGFETLGSMIQQSLQRQAENTTSTGDAQLQALISLKETHKARKVTATFQAGVYGAVTACYLGMMFSPNVAKDPSFFLKLSGATALASLYTTKAIKHKNAANKVQLVIDSLDNTGKNCNPWTNSSCFCSESTSKTLYPTYFEEVCILNRGNFETPKVALGCAAVKENKLEFDKTCKCKQTNTCLKSPLSGVNLQLGKGLNFMKESNRLFNLLAGGEFDQGELSRASLGYASMASKIKLPSDIKSPARALTPEEKKLAEELKKFMPEGATSFAAAAQPQNLSKINDSSLGGAQLGSISKEIKEKLGKAINLNYRQGNGIANSSDSSDEFTFPKMDTSNRQGQDSTVVLNFADEAVSKAEVSNMPSTPIFEIISIRYQKSAWQKLDTEGK